MVIVMDKIFLLVLNALFALLVLSIADMTVCACVPAAGRTRANRFNGYRSTLFYTAALYVIANVLAYLTGIVFLLKGDLKMSSTELILQIASKMHYASMAFIAAALIALAVHIFLAAAGRGNNTGLKEVISSCIWYAVVFWVLAWLII